MRPTYLWDIFCKVIDNYGDIGVCWRLAANLAARGQKIRLWIDDPSALQWMAPGALEGLWPGVCVMPWEQSRDMAVLSRLKPAGVWIEGFGCEIDRQFLEYHLALAQVSQRKVPAEIVWINLEYLSAETFAGRSHGLQSPVMVGPAAGRVRHVFYPGFTTRTGGLLRESDLPQRQTDFDKMAWLAAKGVPSQGEQLIALFCYEPAALADLLAMLAKDPAPTRLLVTHGRAAAVVARLLGPSGLRVAGQAWLLALSL